MFPFLLDAFRYLTKLSLRKLPHSAGKPGKHWIDYSDQGLKSVGYRELSYEMAEAVAVEQWPETRMDTDISASTLANVPPNMPPKKIS